MRLSIYKVDNDYTMQAECKNSVTFVTMAVLVFVAISVFFLMGGIATGPNVTYFVGLTGWLRILKHHETLSVEAFSFPALLLEFFLAIGFTWLLSKLLHRRPKQSAT